MATATGGVVVYCTDRGFSFAKNGVPHLSLNGSNTEPVVAVLARTDPNEHESRTLLPEHDARQ